MSNPKVKQVFEHDRLNVDEVFTSRHLKAMAAYITQNEGCEFYSLLYNGVRFNQYVGVIQVDDLTIEVLPKVDRHTNDKSVWQTALIEMLRISLHVEAKTTTISSVNINKLNVLDAYLLMFLEEVQALLHKGLVKKYRRTESNQTALKGRLLFNQHIAKNLVHAERFYVQHSVYDKNNVYNAVLYKALDVITRLSVSDVVRSMVNTVLFDFPECDDVKVSEKLFSKLVYNRKTAGYKKAVELARIILMNFHPDFKGGRNNILAIMVDMNELWENYIYFTLARAAANNPEISISRQNSTGFWTQPDGRIRNIRPDIVVHLKQRNKSVVLDTKWKYKKDTSVEDARQMYAYGHYFNSEQGFLVYPERVAINKIVIQKGFFNKPGIVNFDKQMCGILWIDLISDDGVLNKYIGGEIIEKLFEHNITL